MALDHIAGLNELEKALKVFDRDQAVRMQRRAMRKASEPLLASARRRVRYDLADPDGPDGYHIRDHLVLQLEPKRTRTSEVDYRAGVARRTAPSGSEYPIQGGLSKSPKSPNYALILEEDDPYLRPAFDETADSMVNIVRSILSKSIERALRKQARQNA